VYFYLLQVKVPKLNLLLPLQAYSGRSGSCSQLRVIFSFYASTIVSALAAVDKVSDAMIAKLLPFVHKVM